MRKSSTGNIAISYAPWCRYIYPQNRVIFGANIFVNSPYMPYVEHWGPWGPYKNDETMVNFYSSSRNLGCEAMDSLYSSAGSI